jgi:uncharacterized protein (TIGR03067 family)
MIKGPRRKSIFEPKCSINYFKFNLMRILLLLAALLTGLVVKGQTKLQGTWLPVRQEMGGKVMQPTAYKGQKLIIQDSLYMVIAESVDKGVVKMNGNKLDIYGRDDVNKGKHFTAVYQLKDGELTICYNLAGSAYPEAFTTQGQPLYFLSVFKKE